MNEEVQLVNNFLENYFYKRWELHKHFSIELMINDKCDQGCTYCYFRRSSSKLDFPKDVQDPDTQLKNLDNFIKWVDKKGFKPSVSLFGGELLTQTIGYELVDRLLDSKHIPRIVIPSNMSFIFDNELISKVEKLYSKAAFNKKELFIGASVDGAFMEENRPMLGGKKRNDEYYDKLFGFCDKHNIGFHPMIYSNNIEKWKDNYKWFKERTDRLYLLEVRNKNWNKEQTRHFCEFYEFLYIESLKNNQKYFFENINKDNFLTNDLSQFDRGIGCSIQTQIHIRLGDLTVFPCHRLMYKGMEYFKFTESFDVIPMNYELMLMIYSFLKQNQPMCESCIIKFACSGGCLGAQYENSRDMFMPILEVCRLKHNKIKTLINVSKKTGTYSELLRSVGEDTRNSIRMLEYYLKRS